MKTLIVLFNLKDGVSIADYEDFAKELDIPTVKSLKSVSEFQVFRSLGIFGSDVPPPYEYVEIIHFDSIENLVSDMGKEPKMAEIPAKFQAFADNPIFIVSESI
jgi:hypothetical protein